MKDSKEEISQYILTKFLPGEKRENLQDNTPLLASGILDSMGLFEMISFIEQRFGIAVDDQDVTFENFGRLQDIAAFIESKLALKH